MVVALFLEFFVGVIIADVVEMFFATNVFPTGLQLFLWQLLLLLQHSVILDRI